MATQEELLEALQKSGFSGPKTEIDKNETFQNLGMDSLDVFNFFVEVERLTGVEVPDEDFESLDTIDKVYRYTESNRNEA